MSELLRRLPNYLKSFGPVAGLRLCWSIERAQPVKSAVVRSWSVPGYPWPIHLREAVGDHATFFQCIVRDQYRITDFPQGRQLMADYQAAVAAGQRPLLIDCGGNIGLATLWWARQMPQARIVVVEPDADNLQILRRNVAPLGDRVTVVAGGVWDRPAKLRIVNPDSGSAAFRVDEMPPDAGEGLRAYTIDELCALGGGGDPFVVKLDIEGAQAQVFRSNTDWTRRTRLIALELDDWLMPWKGTSRPFFSVLAPQPFDYLIGGEAIFCFRDPAAAA